MWGEPTFPTHLSSFLLFLTHYYYLRNQNIQTIWVIQQFWEVSAEK